MQMWRVKHALFICFADSPIRPTASPFQKQTVDLFPSRAFRAPCRLCELDRMPDSEIDRMRLIGHVATL